MEDSVDVPNHLELGKYAFLALGDRGVFLEKKHPKTSMFFGVLQGWGFISQRIRSTVILPKQLICNYKSLLPPTVMNDC